jgi:hypothetical protein
VGWLTDPKSAWWIWTEHVSWIVTVLGVIAIGVAIWQIATELRRRPDIIVGFAEGANLHARPPVLGTSGEIHPAWQPGATMSDPVELRIVAFNRGKRTARNPLINVTFPPELEALIGQGSRGTLHMQSLRDPEGHLRLIAEQPTHHPGVVTLLQVPLKVPRGVSWFPAIAIVNVDDRDPVRTELRVDVR